MIQACQSQRKWPWNRLVIEQIRTGRRDAIFEFALMQAVKMKINSTDTLIVSTTAKWPAIALDLTLHDIHLLISQVDIGR